MHTSYSTWQVALILLNGAIGGAIWILIAHFAGRYTRHVLAFVLVAAAAFYVRFALQGQASSAWTLAELAGLLVYGAMAVAGVRGSPWWLVAGWLLHPMWDVPLHLVAGGRDFAPTAYPIACVTWDWLTAAYLVYRTRRGWDREEVRVVLASARRWGTF
jgi:hypothetical protein